MVQAFHGVWHAGLLHKLQKILPLAYCQIIKSYLQNRLYQSTSRCPAKEWDGAAVVHTLYTSGVPVAEDVDNVMFADNATAAVQQSFKMVQKLINASKSAHESLPIFAEGDIIPKIGALSTSG